MRLSVLRPRPAHTSVLAALRDTTTSGGQDIDMASSRKVAVVTGSNKGIGFAIVRALCKQFEGDVFLTSRDETRGKEALKALQGEGLNPKFHQLDIDDSASIDRLRDFLKEQYGGLDVLVNNAAILYKAKSTAPFAEQAEVTLKTNFWSNLDACNRLFPILKPHARVVNLSSFLCLTALRKCSPELQARFKDPALTMDGLKKLMTEFVSLAQENKHQGAGWPDTAYSVSKMGVTAMTIIQQKQLDAEKRDDIIVNSVTWLNVKKYTVEKVKSAGWTYTRLIGAETPVMLALIPANASSPRGQFLSEKEVQVWG